VTNDWLGFLVNLLNLCVPSVLATTRLDITHFITLCVLYRSKETNKPIINIYIRGKVSYLTRSPRKKHNYPLDQFMEAFQNVFLLLSKRRKIKGFHQLNCHSFSQPLYCSTMSVGLLFTVVDASIKRD
jgi:hypothetical protein